jgi:ubiquinone/menaquinone biosynthesis C-methylase UbiE
MNQSLYVHYGSHFCAPESWENFDASPTLVFERIPIIGLLYTKNSARFPANVRYGDIVKGLPVLENSCKVVYCSHTLEHLCLKDLRTALVNTYKILDDGGTFRLVVPDLEYSIKTYLNDISSDAAINFLKETYLGQETRKRGVIGFIADWLGNNKHLWMWDFKSLEKELSTAGFKNIRRAYFGDSLDVAFRDVENYERWKNCLGIECKK